MATNNYCDSKELERYWFLWRVASAVPDLEPYRERGCLWTSVPRTVLSPTKKRRDPGAQSRQHVVVTHEKLYAFGSAGSRCDGRAVPCTTETLSFEGGYVALPDASTLKPMNSYDVELDAKDFFKEMPQKLAFEHMSHHILNICNGVAVKFHPTTEEEKHDLAHGALVLVLDKIKKGKLTYTPGRAPVFNLITTTIYNCLYSVKNKAKRENERRNKLAEDIAAGSVSPNTRTLKAAKPL